MTKYWLLFLVTLAFAFGCGAAVRSGSPTAAVSAVVSDAQLNPLEKLHREIAKRREVSSLQRDSLRTATPKLDANDRPLANSNSQPSNVISIAEDTAVREKGAPVLPAALTKRLSKTKTACLPPRCRRRVQISEALSVSRVRKADLLRQGGDRTP